MKNKIKCTIHKAGRKAREKRAGGPKRLKELVRYHKWKMWKQAKFKRKVRIRMRAVKKYAKAHGKDRSLFGPIGMFLKSMFCKY